ncbi:hypothetical protein AVEN_187398-1 [Araneus ventricosus]|uniref:Uncharacterized protein n=1 Tax=Araneus ventricosus TaxID=182803 RepID=A0A4Y2MAD4_ARAVE|nr:hypothetical protein AVEN_187398-1 [Araneus ventricosus]
MYRSFQNETNPLPKLWIRISNSELESVIPNPRNQSESNSDSRIPFRGFITNPIQRIYHESDSVDSSRIRFRGFIPNPIPGIHSDSKDSSRIRFRGFIPNPIRRIVPFGRNRIRSFLLRIRILGFVLE